MDATFFCGSCAVIRRGPLDEIGGIAVETVTEDAHTSLRLHRRGYTSAYMRIPQAAGLATESLSAHIGQRIRWARGMVQIFRLDNPLFGKGLKLVQRVCYANAMLHFSPVFRASSSSRRRWPFCCSMPISFMRQR
ncbi:cellulose synthase catalytic subunit [Klebsiella pneumoniae]|uniref:Cellulose synthase catalytic subunit n=1 Tax=Klebsiella pneumoniae TaxID=573 RepID=A0A2X3C7L5_KLEPN|nr:cellulose synthase catalytic subunit [Klebsiella pneumoniae]